MSAWADRSALYVDGAWRPASTPLQPVLNPATEEPLCLAPVGGLGDLDAALDAARRAADQGPWPRLAPAERADLLDSFVSELEARVAELTALVMAETGAVGGLAKRLHVRTAIDHFRHYVALGRRDPITPVAISPGHERWPMTAAIIVREPFGVVAAITPFNFPFFLNIEKIAPALAAGNTVVLKPSPLTPLEALMLGDVADAVGLPPGVLNVVTGGVDVAQHLTTDPRVDLISFTGSDAVGAEIMAQAAPNLTPVLLELGGKSALIVRADADLDAAVPFGLAQFTIQAGQGCALCTRHLVHRSILDDYVEALATFSDLVPVGDPADRSTGMGPLISAARREAVEGMVDAARVEGVTIVRGGRRPEHLERGFFYEPTIVTGLANRSSLAQREVFGPVVVVIGFDTDDEAVAIANDSPYGLSGAVFSADVAAATAVALGVRTGYVTVNGGGGTMHPALPFGGYKRSGIGRELGELGFDAYRQVKSIDANLGSPSFL
jgi:aldehyde dehydrogenase (NAD+)